MFYEKLNTKFMRSIFLSAGLLFSIVLTAQQQTNVDANNTANTNQLQALAGSGGNSPQGGFTGAATYYNPKFDRIGTIYLFDDWNNYARIFPKGASGSFTVQNINFNVQRSMFETKNRDSIRSYNFASIEKIQVGSRSFRSFYFEPLQRNKVFEVVYQGEDFSILKDYILDIQEANPNPMIARNRDKLIRRSTYYLETSESLKEFKFSKRNILKALGDEKAAIASDYAKKYQMSFRNEEDLRKILNYVKRQ